MSSRRVIGSLSPATVAVLLAAAALIFTSVAAAKEFKPGDLRACNARDCVTITNQKVLDALSSFIYMGPQPAIAHSPNMGVPYFELRFRNGYVAGIVATAKLDRWLSYGVYLERFRRGRWYRVPAGTALALRTVTPSLTPRRLTRAAVGKSR